MYCRGRFRRSKGNSTTRLQPGPAPGFLDFPELWSMSGPGLHRRGGTGVTLRPQPFPRDNSRWK